MYNFVAHIRNNTEKKELFFAPCPPPFMGSVRVWRCVTYMDDRIEQKIKLLIY